MLNVSASGIVSSLVDKYWNSTAAYNEGDLLVARGIRSGVTLARDPQGNLLLGGQEAVYLVPAVDGTYYGKAMLAGHVYAIAGDRRTSGGNTGAIDDVPATSIRIRIGHVSPQQIAVDAQGNLFFGDNCGYSHDKGLLRMVPRTSGTYYGQTMTAGYIYSLSSEALSNGTYVMNVGVDGAGNVYFIRGLSSFGNPIRKVAPDGNVTDPAPGISVAYLAAAGDGTVYASSGRIILKIAGGVTTQIMAAAAGSSEDGVPLALAQVNSTGGLVASSEGHLYFADTNCIRMIPKTNGTYHGKAMLANHLYVVAGTRSMNSPDGTPREHVFFDALVDLKMDALGNLYILSGVNSAAHISMIPAVSGTYFGKAMLAGHLYLVRQGEPYPYALAVTPAGELYFNSAQGLKKIALSGVFSNVAAEPNTQNASMNTDALGNLYLSWGYRIRMLPAVSGTYFGQAMTAGTLYTIAGNGTSGNATGAALGATVQGYEGMVFDTLNNLYFSSGGTSQVIRMVPNVAGTYFGQAMSVGDIYTLATLSNNSAKGLAIDSLGNVYGWTSGVEPKIHKLSTNGQLSVFAGGSTVGDGIPAKNAKLSMTAAMRFGPDGALYLGQGLRVMRIL
ncbi:hypothetical protein D3C72_197440 [compost metagenome]